MIQILNQIQRTMAISSCRTSELRAFDDTKAGVKGLVDAGITKIPHFFHQPQDASDSTTTPLAVDAKFSFPVIDLQGLHNDSIRRKQVVDQVQNASETWGFFQVLNHGIPISVLQEMKDGIRRFYEQDIELKKKFYTRDYSKKAVYNSNFDLYTAPAANWRDTLFLLMAPDPPKEEHLPAVCR